MKALNTQSLVRSVSKLAMFATFTASALISGQAFAGKPSPPPANFVQIEVPVTYNFGYPAHIDPRTGDTCMYNPNNSVFCMGFPVAFAMTASNEVAVIVWYADWSTPASVSVLRGKAFDEVDAKLLDQVYAAETSDYVFNLRFTDTVIVDVWGDGSERYKVGFVNCSLGTETDNCATTSPAADNVIRMTAAPL